MFKRALISTSLSDGLYRLVNCLPALGESGLQQIVFTHCVALEGRIPKADHEKIEWAKSRLSVLGPNVAEGVEVVTEIVSASKPHEAILELAKKHHSDLIVLGSHTHSLMGEKIFGSTSMTLTQNTQVPIMVLRPELISTYTSEELNLRCRHLFRYLMLAYDGSSSGQYLLKQFKSYAQNRPQNSLEKCLLIWVVEEGGHRDVKYEVEKAKRELETVKVDLLSLGLAVETEVRQGEVMPQLAEAACVHDISAIAVACRRKNKLVEWSAPSTSNQILRTSWHPILYFAVNA